MKTILAIAPQFSGYPIKIVAANTTKEKLAVVVPFEDNTSTVSTVRMENITDLPEQWDESWFANYE